MTTPLRFESDLNAFGEKALRNLDAIVRGAAFEVLARVQRRTPVDTGYARNNWFAAQGTPPKTLPTPKNRRGREVAGRARAGQATAVLGRVSAGPPVYIVNAVPYIERLENGHSKQAPQGMVRLTAQEWPQIVQQVAGAFAR